MEKKYSIRMARPLAGGTFRPSAHHDAPRGLCNPARRCAGGRAAGDRGADMKADINLKLIAGNSNTPLAEAIARRMGVYRGARVELADARVERFNDREIFVEIFDNVRGEDVFIIQSTCNPANDNLMELLIIADALRRSSASRITAVIPYFGYARQDRRTAARTPISAKLVANLITHAGIDRVLTMDLHAGQIQGFFDMPVDNLYASPVFAMDIRHHFGDLGRLTIVSPDVGGVGRARELAKRLDLGLAIVDKRRAKPGEVAEMTVIGEVKDRTCLIVDDICDTAGTLVKAAQLLMDKGAEGVHAYISHGVLSPPAVERVSASAMKSLVVTDSIPLTEEAKAADNIRTVSVAPMLAQAILNVANDTSVSSLFSEDTLRPIYEAFYRFD
jgi:ribose-phosphate pyrophosphokinase